MTFKSRLLLLALFFAVVALAAYARVMRKQAKDARDDLRKLEMVSRRQTDAAASLDRKVGSARADAQRFKNLYLELRSTSTPWKVAWLNAEGRKFLPAGEDPLLPSLTPEHAAAVEKLRRSASDLLQENFDFESDALLGRAPWMHFRQEVQAVNCPASVYLDAVEGIANVHQALQRRGVRLIFCPVPAKWELHPEGLVDGMRAEFDLNPQRTELMRRLRERGVWAVDLAPAFREALASGRLERVYFFQDTHWTPAAIDFAAGQLAAEIRASGIALPAMNVIRQEGREKHRGDLTPMLEAVDPLPEGFEAISEPYAFFEVPDFDNASAPVVVSGRSFSWTDATGIGRNIGMSPQLSFHLQSPVQQYGGGAIGLRAAVRADPTFLEGKKIVVWTLPMRDFWEAREVFSDNRLARDFFGEGIEAEGEQDTAEAATVFTVTATSPEIPPARLVYKDLVSVFAAESPGLGTRFFYYHSVRDRQLLLPRFVRAGDRLRFRSIAWSDQTARHPEFGTMTLDDPLSEPSDEIFYVTEWIDLPR